MITGSIHPKSSRFGISNCISDLKNRHIIQPMSLLTQSITRPLGGMFFYQISGALIYFIFIKVMNGSNSNQGWPKTLIFSHGPIENFMFLGNPDSSSCFFKYFRWFYIFYQMIWNIESFVDILICCGNKPNIYANKIIHLSSTVATATNDPPISTTFKAWSAKIYI